jgi:hypothetical protein
MAYEAKKAVYLPVTDYLNLEFFLMDTRPGTAANCSIHAEAQGRSKT